MQNNMNNQQPAHPATTPWLSMPKFRMPKRKQPANGPATSPAQIAVKPLTRRELALAIGKSLLFFTWTKYVLSWLILSAGIMAECVFVVASLWLSVNASVHPFMLKFMTQDMTVTLNDLASTAYVGLPVCILFLACLTVIGHFNTWWQQGHLSSLVWCALYAIPTSIFLAVDVVTLTNSVAILSTSASILSTFTLPTYLVQARALAGYAYGFIAFMYANIGMKQEFKRLAIKDNALAELHQTIQRMSTEHAANMAKMQQDFAAQLAQVSAELDAKRRELASLNYANSRLEVALNQSAETSLGAYSEECKAWLFSGNKSFPIEEVALFTGISKRRIENAIGRKELKTPTSSKTKVEFNSLVSWLKTQHEFERQTDALPSIFPGNGHTKETINLDGFVNVV